MKKSLFAVVVVLLACTSLTYAQSETDLIESITGYNIYDFNFVGGGTRAKGMGNAFIGVSNDVTGGSWNPAGLYELDQTTIGISWFNLSPNGSTASQSISDYTLLKHSGSFNDLSSLNFISPIRIKGHPFVFSLNLTRNFNNFKQYAIYASFPKEFITTISNLTYTDTSIVDVNQSFREEGGVSSLNFAFGTRFRNNVSMGVSVNIYTGKSVFNVQTNTRIEDYHERFTDQISQIDEYVTVEDTNKFSGANFTVGFMYNGDNLDAGLTIRTPFDLKENREQGIYTINKRNSIPILTDTVFNSDILYKYEMPLMIGAGVGYQVNDDWLLAGDIEYRGFSGKKINFRVSQTINPGGSNIDSFIVIDPSWNNSFSVRLGSEYIKSFDFGDVPLRAGFGYVPIPGPSLDAFGNSSTVVNYNFTAGTGIHWNQIHFDVAYTYTKTDSEYGPYSGTFDYRNHTVDVSFTGVF